MGLPSAFIAAALHFLIVGVIGELEMSMPRWFMKPGCQGRSIRALEFVTQRSLISGHDETIIARWLPSRI